MGLETTTIGITLGLLVGLVLLRYSGYLDRVKKAAGFIVAGAMFYFINIAWTAGTFASKVSSSAAGWLTFVWELIAFILIIIGSLWAAAELVTKSK